jgi:hypothetical protein
MCKVAHHGVQWTTNAGWGKGRIGTSELMWMKCLNRGFSVLLVK